MSASDLIGKTFSHIGARCRRCEGYRYIDSVPTDERDAECTCFDYKQKQPAAGMGADDDQPNAESLAALEEVANDETVAFATWEDFFADLHADDDDEC